MAEALAGEEAGPDTNLTGDCAGPGCSAGGIPTFIRGALEALFGVLGGGLRLGGRGGAGEEEEMELTDEELEFFLSRRGTKMTEG
jgi:hypothetical protein